MIGQLVKLVGEVNVTHCLQSPLPPITKVPVPFLLELIMGHVVLVPHITVATSICVTARGTLLVFSIAKAKAPPGPGFDEFARPSSGMKSLLASASPASTCIVTRVASAAPPWRNPSWLALKVKAAYAAPIPTTMIPIDNNTLTTNFFFMFPPGRFSRLGSSSPLVVGFVSGKTLKFTDRLTVAGPLGSMHAPGEGTRACRHRRPHSWRRPGGQWRSAAQGRRRRRKDCAAGVRRCHHRRDDGRPSPRHRGRVVPAVCRAGGCPPADDGPARPPAAGPIGQSSGGARDRATSARRSLHDLRGSAEPGGAVRRNAASPDRRRRPALDRSRIRRGPVLRRPPPGGRTDRHALRSQG